MPKKLYFWLGLSPIILSALLTLFILLLMKQLPSRLPLFYSLAWGEKQLVTHEQFLIIPAGIVLITMLNFTISSSLHSSQAFFKKILYIASGITSLILTITFIKIMLLF